MSTPKKNEMTTTNNEPHLPTAILDRMAKDAGKGTSTAQEDNIIPLIYILQAQSPQVNKRSPEYIEGAEAGSIWVRNSPHPIVKGEEGILVQPCHFFKNWVEWRPRDSGGGYVSQHDDRPPEAQQSADPKNPNKVRWTLPSSGNDLVETRYHVVYVITPTGPAPYVIPMASSGHTVSRNWMFMMNQKQIAGIRAPSWAGLYRLRTKERSNAAGTWFTWDVSDAGWIANEQEYNRGDELNRTVSSGERQAAAPVINEEIVVTADDAM